MRIDASDSIYSFSSGKLSDVAENATMVDKGVIPEKDYIENDTDSLCSLIGNDSSDSLASDTLNYVSTDRSGRDFLLALGTNMLFDVLAVPNLSAEACFGNGWGVRLDGMYAWWSNKPKGKYWRLQGGSLTLRKYFGRLPFSGHHVGVFGSILRYDFCLGAKGVLSAGFDEPFRVRPSWSTGVEYGYSFVLSHRLRIDLSAGFGYQGGLYMRYHNEDGQSIWDSTHSRHWFGPVRAEASLVWIIGKGGGL